jgi:hypothetical protein
VVPLLKNDSFQGILSTNKHLVLKRSNRAIAPLSKNDKYAIEFIKFIQDWLDTNVIVLVALREL